MPSGENPNDLPISRSLLVVSLITDHNMGLPDAKPLHTNGSAAPLSQIQERKRLSGINQAPRHISPARAFRSVAGSASVRAVAVFVLQIRLFRFENKPDILSGNQADLLLEHTITHTHTQIHTSMHAHATHHSVQMTVFSRE